MTATPATVARQYKQLVYIDVPPSPYPILSSVSRKNVLTSLSLKENALLPSASLPETPLLKRKPSEHDLLVSNSKKQKIHQKPAVTPINAPPEYPNGFVYCHQCSRKCDAPASIHCTWTSTVKGVQKQCSVKICHPCLKNRYGENAMDIKAATTNGAYNFKCPKCRDICNCRRCRKLKGLPPTGKVSREKTINPQMAVGTPSKRKVEVLITTTPYKGVSPNVPAPVIKPSLKSGPAPKKIAAKPKQQTLHQAIPQVLPQLKWIELPTSLTMENASSRFQIREFILRFTSIMEPSIPRSQLAEFDDLGCGPDDDDDENGEMAPWVSDACVRSMILALLKMLVGLEGNALKHVQTALREIRASGNNLSKIWGILAQMRDLTEDQFSFPDPLPLPASATVYNTRTMRSSKELNSGKPLLVIGHTAQMIPVVEALIEVALRTPTVREELEHGFTKAKELTRDVQKAVKEENERWDAERKSLELQKEKDNNRASEIKSKRTAHKMRINDLECALKLVMPAFASRFAPLGTDQVGRTYWVSSPGIVERKAALDFIASTSLSKKAKTQVAESCSSRKWPWFIAVWGKSTRAAGGKGAEADDGAPERWWAFTEPAEIRKAADWIRIDARIDPYAPLELDTNKPLASLVKGLNEYATLLDWRLKVDKYGGFAD